MTEIDPDKVHDYVYQEGDDQAPRTFKHLKDIPDGVIVKGRPQFDNFARRAGSVYFERRGPHVFNRWFYEKRWFGGTTVPEARQEEYLNAETEAHGPFIEVEAFGL